MARLVICPRCQKTFTVPPEHGDVWRSCPYCSEVNPAALVRKEAGVSGLSCLGVLLLLAGAVGGSLGTLLCAFGIEFFGRHTQLLTLAWAMCSVAVFITGVRLVRANYKPSVVGSVWGPGGVFLVILLIGICGWVFVFGTCNGGFN